MLFGSLFCLFHWFAITQLNKYNYNDCQRGTARLFNVLAFAGSVVMMFGQLMAGLTSQTNPTAKPEKVSGRTQFREEGLFNEYWDLYGHLFSSSKWGCNLD
jgi:hypothetical protein